MALVRTPYRLRAEPKLILPLLSLAPCIIQVVYAALILSSSIGISLTFSPFCIFDSFLSNLPTMSARGSTSPMMKYEAADSPLLPKYEMADELYRKYLFSAPNIPLPNSSSSPFHISDHAVKILGDYVGKEHTGAFKVLDDTSRSYTNRSDLERALIDCNHALSLDCPPEAKVDLRSLRAKVYLVLDEWDKAEDDAKTALIDIRSIIAERHPFEQYAFEIDSSTDAPIKVPLTLAENEQGGEQNVCVQPSDLTPLLSMEENERNEFGFSSASTSTAIGTVDDFLILKIKEGVLMLELAEIYRMQAKLGKPTEELLHAALRLFEKVAKRRQEGATVHDGSNTATARANLGSFYMHTGRLAEAEKHQRDALAQVHYSIIPTPYHSLPYTLPSLHPTLPNTILYPTQHHNLPYP